MEKLPKELFEYGEQNKTREYSFIGLDNQPTRVNLDLGNLN